MRISDWSSDVCSSDLKALDSPPCSSHPQKLQAHEPLHAVLAHEHTLQCTAAEPGQSAAASMPSQWTSGVPSMRTTSPHTHQIPLELEVPSAKRLHHQWHQPTVCRHHCLVLPDLLRLKIGRAHV